jgi:hypothetical protein
MRKKYKMVAVGLVLAAILVMILTTAVMAASNNQGLADCSGSISYDAQNGYGQQNCQRSCDGDCDVNCQGNCNVDCDQNKDKSSGQCDCSCNNKLQGTATNYNNRSCNGICFGK